MTGPNVDPTAGERARAITSQPGAFHPIVDPTDPSYCETSRMSRRARAGARLVFDPTNPEYGRRAD
jgi:hypothetical protein